MAKIRRVWPIDDVLPESERVNRRGQVVSHARIWGSGRTEIPECCLGPVAQGYRAIWKRRHPQRLAKETLGTAEHFSHVSVGEGERLPESLARSGTWQGAIGGGDGTREGIVMMCQRSCLHIRVIPDSSSGIRCSPFGGSDAAMVSNGRSVELLMKALRDARHNKKRILLRILMYA